MAKRWTQQQFEGRTEEFLPELYRAARRFAARPEDAEDLVHDTYVKAFRAFSKADLASADDCRAWLYRILVNTFRDQYRRRLRAPVVEVVAKDRDGGEAVNVVELAASLEPSPATQVAHRHFAAAARAAIADLAPEVRIAATLFFLEGFSYRRIAETTQCPIGTVMSRLSRGRAALRRALGDHASLLGADDDFGPSGQRWGGGS